MTARISLGFIFVTAVCVGCASHGVTPASSTPDTSAAAGAPVPGVSAGLRVYKDPQTGEFTDPPATLPTAPVERALNRSHEGLVAVPNTAVPGGGVKLDLQGRFRSHFVATKDAEGNVSVRCVPEQELPEP